MTTELPAGVEKPVTVLHGELLRFLVVGASAAAVHFVVVLLLVQWYALQPLLANIAAFITAFQVSYFGHRFWTFAHTDTQHSQSLPRFLLVAVLGFASNECLYYLLLQYTTLPYWLSLGMVLVLVAVMTFVLSKLWAFSHKR
ncbi:MAG TPA: GtrA family protein [Pseudomonadales bacterium]|nr:GtrA family protein [Pseudomonadales bacterium]